MAWGVEIRLRTYTYIYTYACNSSLSPISKRLGGLRYDYVHTHTYTHMHVTLPCHPAINHSTLFHCSQISILLHPVLHVFWETWRGETRSQENPRSSKQWKSFCEMRNPGILHFSKLIRFLNNYEN